MDSERSLKAWMASVAFGVGSEVWMHRQASMMDELDLTVVTNRYDNSNQYPAVGFDVQLVEGRWRLPRTRRIREVCLALLGKRNRKVPGFSASKRETNWWIERIGKDSPKVCLAQFGTAALWLLPLMQHAGIPLVAHFHGYDLSRSLRQARYREQLRRSADRIAAYVVCAKYMEEALVDLGVSPDRIHLIPYGVPIPSETAENRGPPHSCRFISVGRLVEKKRPDLTVRAFAEAAKSRPEISLKMIGEGPLLHRCQTLAKSLLQDPGQIEFAGQQAQTVVQQSLRNADVFVQHSVTAADGDKEGWPVAIAEAAAIGLPVIATRHASIPEQIEDGVAGLLCDEFHWREMGHHIGKLSDNQEMCVAMGNAARRHIAEFSVGNQVKKLQQVMVMQARG